MHCRHARTAIVKRELNLLSREVSEALDTHLHDCRACSAASAEEQRFVSRLAALRGEIPFELDVTPRVMSQIATRWVRRIPEVTPRQLGWCAVVAVAGAIALAVTAWSIAPDLEPIARAIGSLTAGLFGLVERMAGVGMGLLSIPFKLLGALLRSAGGLVPVLHELQPLATGAATFAMLVMMTTIAYFVGRDWVRQGSATEARSETR